MLMFLNLKNKFTPVIYEEMSYALHNCISVNFHWKLIIRICDSVMNHQNIFVQHKKNFLVNALNSLVKTLYSEYFGKTLYSEYFGLNRDLLIYSFIMEVFRKVPIFGQVSVFIFWYNNLTFLKQFILIRYLLSENKSLC